MPLTEERMDRIQLEETRNMNRTPDMDEDERQFRAGIAKDIAMMHSQVRRGWPGREVSAESRTGRLKPLSDPAGVRQGSLARCIGIAGTVR